MTLYEMIDFIEGVEDLPPTKPGMYTLYRGSHNGNESPSVGIYANGIHYSTDPTTAQEFGEVKEFKVSLKKP